MIDCPSETALSREICLFHYLTNLFHDQMYLWCRSREKLSTNMDISYEINIYSIILEWRIACIKKAKVHPCRYHNDISPTLVLSDSDYLLTGHSFSSHKAEPLKPQQSFLWKCIISFSNTNLTKQGSGQRNELYLWLTKKCLYYT